MNKWRPAQGETHAQGLAGSMGTQALADTIPVDKSCAFVCVCEPAHRHAWDSRHLGAEAVSARFQGEGLLLLHVLSQFAHMHRNYTCTIHTLVWGSCICTYTHTDTPLWVYIHVWGLGIAISTALCMYSV